ncbi:hypothetical protein EAO79_12045 [Plantibacter sp. PA-3-X8]|nr:hypothetical protein EAO79_12045 [Plantibacter sp. PA-3-X8]
MLAEAVANAGSWSTTDLNRRERYLDLISTLTPGHIRILRYLSSPQGWFAKHRPEAISEISNSYMQSVGQVLSRYFFEGDEELARRGFDAVSDLVAERLVQVDLSTIGTGPGALESRTTADGESLLSFLGDIGEDPTA